MPDWTTDEWQAIHNHLPGSPRELRVTGMVHAPTDGYEFRLCLKEPQGINPKDLLLQLEVKEPSGGVSEVLTDYPVEYTKTTDAEYDSVTVIGGASSIEVIHPTRT